MWGINQYKVMSTELLAPDEKLAQRIDLAITGENGLGDNGAMSFSNVGQIMEFAKLMSVAAVAIPGHLRKNPGACLAVCIQASEWGMSPFAVANKSYSVNDRLAYESQLINAVILRRAPIKGRFKITYTGEGPTRRCKVSALLLDGDSVEYESPQFSAITVKNSPLWKSDPDQQLFYFSSRSMCRRHFPDVLLGIYDKDELEAPRDRVVQARAVPIDPFNQSLPEFVDTQETGLEDAPDQWLPESEEVDP